MHCSWLGVPSYNTAHAVDRTITCLIVKLNKLSAVTLSLYGSYLNLVSTVLSYILGWCLLR